MSESNEFELTRLIAKDAIRQQMMRYVRGVDRRDYDLVRSTYHEDAYDDHGPFKGGADEFIEWLSDWHRELEQGVHFFGASLFEFADEHTTFVETPAIIVQRYRPSARTPNRTLILCRYLDNWEKREGIWRVSRRRVVMETVWHTDHPEPVYDPVWSLGTRDATDPLWDERARFFGSNPEHI